ncbi:GPP34 family phosphoprotein [Georgenia sp. Z1344]|uniref:GPP34 family phosphoprotein n=1 Tax=Georgenia sp. Z1344 TaxID=3416706 RepID=UPI003CF578F9
MPAQLLADVLLLVHDDETGACLVDTDTLRRLAVESAAEQVLAGGTLRIHEKRKWRPGPGGGMTRREIIQTYVPVEGGPTPPPGYDAIAAWLVGQDPRGRAGGSRGVGAVAGAADHLVATTLDQLVAAGTLVRGHSTALGDRRGTTYQEAAPEREDRLRERIRCSMGQAPTDGRTAAVLPVLHRSDVGEHAVEGAGGKELDSVNGHFYLREKVSRDTGRWWVAVLLFVLLVPAIAWALMQFGRIPV